MNIDPIAVFTMYHPQNNRAVEEAIRHLPMPMRADASAGSGFKDILAQLLSGDMDEASRMELLHLLRHGKAFANMGSFTRELQQLAQLVAQLEGGEGFTALAEKFLKQPQGGQNDPLEALISASGLLLESKIKKALESGESDAILSRQWRQDLKAALLNLLGNVGKLGEPHSEQAEQLLNRLLFKIDYFQLLSSLFDGTALFIPYDFKELKEGQVYFRKGDDAAAYCEIRLELERYGVLNVMSALENKKKLTLLFHTPNAELTALLKTGMGSLKSALLAMDIRMESVRFFSTLPSQDTPYSGMAEHYTSGFRYRA